MKGFQFNLEKVLEVRQIEEDQVQELLVKAQKWPGKLKRILNIWKENRMTFTSISGKNRSPTG